MIKRFNETILCPCCVVEDRCDINAECDTDGTIFHLISVTCPNCKRDVVDSLGGGLDVILEALVDADETTLPIFDMEN